VIAELENSALRGLAARASRRAASGESFARKLRHVSWQSTSTRASQGLSRTLLLERDPHRFLEGMLIAAWAVGIDEIYVYLRDEYAACRAILTRELEALTRDPPGLLPRIHLRRGAGAYIAAKSRR